MEKLELKHLSPYLPYRLRVNYNGKGIFHDSNDGTNHYIGKISVDEWGDHIWILEDEKEFYSKGYSSVFIKPILRPLSDLNKKKYLEIFVKNDIDDILDAKRIDESLDVIEFYLVQGLISLHFDVFGLIEKGLAIDINKL